MSESERLRELAEAATPGPWRVSETRGRRDGYVRAGATTVADLRYKNGSADAAYIAAVSPDVVLRLLRIEEAAREAIPSIIASLGGHPAHDSGCTLCALREALEDSHVGK